MNLLMTHGYMLSGTGSNVYVQNLCRALVKMGHDVHLLCQEPTPLSYDFVNEHYEASESGVELLEEQASPYPGFCAVFRPEIDDLLPVYVYDDYPGWLVKTFLDLTKAEFDNYVTKNVAALRAALDHSGAAGAVTNHSVPGPEIARQALAGVPYASIVHGSCLQYVARRSEKYMEVARQGLSGATSIVALSTHSAGTIAEDFPEMTGKTYALPGGVDTDLFRPDALDLSVTERLSGGPGRGPEEAAQLRKVLDGFPETRGAEDLAGELRAISDSYEPRRYDRDAGERIRELLDGEEAVIVYVGKLIHSKGVHCLISAFARVRRRASPGARLLVIGYGTFREGLEALTYALSTGNRRVAGLLRSHGRLFEGGPASSLEHFQLPDELFRDAEGMERDVAFVGPLYHEELSRILPAAEVAVVPSIFPETFGLVAAEFGASGVPPFVADHSGLREAGELVGRGLPFDPHVGLEDGFEANLVQALNTYLDLPAKERRLCREIVRHNSVADLSWGALAGRIAVLAEGEQTSI